VRVERERRIASLRLVWVAPVTVVVAVAVCYGLRWLFTTIDPNLQRMGQLGPPMLALTVEGAVAAIVVFVLFALFVPRPIFWYRIVGGVALVLSWLPDVALGMGGAPMGLALRYVSPLTRLPLFDQGGPPPGGPPPGVRLGGPPPSFTQGMPWEQVFVLMALHAVVAIVCIVLLTTLSQRVVSRRAPSE
jgi:hypothetical protein